MGKLLLIVSLFARLAGCGGISASRNSYPPKEIHGTVVDGKSGRPMPHKTVAVNLLVPAFPMVQPVLVAQTVTDSAGRFTYRTEIAGDYIFAVAGIHPLEGWEIVAIPEESTVVINVAHWRENRAARGD